MWCGVVWCGGGGGADMTITEVCLSIPLHACILIRVAEHLGASSRRPRHPFPALMAGEPLAVYLCTRPKKVKPSTHEQHLWSCTTGTSTTATLAHQLELEVVVVVGAKKTPMLLNQHSACQNTQRSLGTEKNRRGISSIGLTLSQTES